MKAIAGIRPSSAPLARPVAGQWPDHGPAAAPAPGRSLVAPARPPHVSSAHRPGARPSAAFLAHLIATAQQAPQTRARQRAEPADAIACYAAASRLHRCM